MEKFLASKFIEHLEINKDKKTVACVGSLNPNINLDDSCELLKKTSLKYLIKYYSKMNRIVTKSKTCLEDEFDPYIGSALAICYNLFGSKSQFYKYVDGSIKEYEIRQAIKKEALSKKEELNAKNITNKSITETSSKRKRGRPSKQK